MFEMKVCLVMLWHFSLVFALPNKPLSVVDSLDLGIDDSKAVNIDVDNVPERTLNLRPIIGILSQELSRSMNRTLTAMNKNFTSYIAASYVKSIESAGARVVPILINQPDEYYIKLASSLNGIVYPGGSASITNSSGYGRAGQLLYELVMESQEGAQGDPLPLWATCLGFEMLLYLAGGKNQILTRCKAQNRADPLHFTTSMNSSKLFQSAPKDLLESAKINNITSNFHKYCVMPETFADLQIDTSFDILSTNLDDEGARYVSTVEHKHYPIFGTQWHPEKAPYEWKKPSVPHCPDAIRIHNHLVTVFVGEARKNFNSFSNKEEEDSYLIYNYVPTYTAKLYNASSFEQCYFF